MKKTLIAFLSFILTTPAFANEGFDVDNGDLPDVDIVETQSSSPAVTLNIPEVKTEHTSINYTPPAPQQPDTQQTYIPVDDTDDNTYDAEYELIDPVEVDQALQQLQANSDAAHENETSLENRLIGAAGIGATGIGGMMIGEALSEQDADDDIEKQMRAYINTFRCEYGNYPAVAGGKTNVELPGGNELFNLYAQYATLSNDLKVRKEALGIKPGIESEVVWDKAETGLYDDVGTGIVAGSYASVARALLLGGADAAAWAAQKNATAEKLQTGIIVAGAGAIGSALANAQLNRHNKKNKIPEVQELNKSLQQLPEQSDPCPAGTTIAGLSPNCGTCTDTTKRYNPQSNQCESCEINGQIVIDNKCQCPDERPEIAYGKCVETPKTCDTQCGVTPNDHLQRNNDSCTCSCTNNYIPNNPNNATICSCPEETHELDNDGNCVEKTPVSLPEEEEIPFEDSIVVPNGTAFKINDWKLLSPAKEQITNFLTNIHKEYTQCEITNIDGYADPTGSVQTNKNLSNKRAGSVNDFLVPEIKKYSNISITATPHGHGEFGCKCIEGHMSGECEHKNIGDPLSTEANPTDVVYEPCRRVEVKVSCTKANEQ